MKKLFMILICLALIYAASGCSGRSGGDVDMSAGEAAAKLMETVTFRDFLVNVADDVAVNHYRFDDSVTEFSVYLSGNGATAEEITVLKMDAGEDAATLKPILEKRVESQKLRYADYVPGELKKLEDPVILSKGNMIIMVLADDALEAEKAVNDLFSANTNH